MFGCECEQLLGDHRVKFAKLCLKDESLCSRRYHVGGLTHELRGLYKDRELTRTKVVVSIEKYHDNGETVADAYREKAPIFFWNVSSRLWGGALRDDSKNGCEGDCSKCFM